MIVTGTFLDAAGNPQSGIEVSFLLDGYDGDYPRLQGTSMLVPLRVVATTDVNGKISATVDGNDTITPTGTYYRVGIAPNAELFLEREYVLSGSTVDLSTLTPAEAVASPTPVASVKVALAPTAAGNFTVAHGLGRVPTTVIFQMTSGISVWLQTPTSFDATNLYLVASDAGTGYALVW